MFSRSRRWMLAALLAAGACDSADSSGPADEAAAGSSAPGSGKADGAATESSVRPVRVTLVDNSLALGGVAGPTRATPALAPVSSSTLQVALQDLATDVEFADYPFSGCHDRAHVTYLHLARALGPNAVAKVWIFGPALMTVALDGGLTAPIDENRWGAPTTLWDYHVAAVVQIGSELVVVDPVLSAMDEPLPLDGWFDAITTPPGSVYTVLPGELYSFNTAGPSDFSGGRMPFNGGMFEYSGFARNARWLEANLARDAVAESLADGPGLCPQLSNELDDAQFLVDSLSWMATRFDNAPGCQPFVDQFVQQRDAWTAHLQSL